ncbi:protein-L-isoaspartate O-methyltransferase [Amorphus sp. 3PC139-8]
MVDYATLRSRMVENQLRTYDVTDYRLQKAMGEVPREVFLPTAQRPLAYLDEPLPLTEPGLGVQPRYLNRPAVFGKMLQSAEIEPTDLVLVVGAGTGYPCAVIGQLADSVVGLECDEALSAQASERLAELGIENAAIVTGPLEAGWPNESPYDVIVVDGAVETSLDTLTSQLKDGGRLVAIVGRGLSAMATVYRRSGDTVGRWPSFNAAAPILPGFERKPEFVF